MDANNIIFASGNSPFNSLRGFIQQFGIVAVVWFSTTTIVCAVDLASEKLPKTLYVTVEKANLYSGPSKDFYPTSQLKRGTTLEVYQRTATGWLAVRPPEGSFSWIPATQAYLLPGGRIIEVTDPKAVSWIGTELGSAKQYRWQVQLKVGEQLTVLGESSLKSDDDDGHESLWYRVAPPAGEFRWVEQEAVSENSPEPSAIASASIGSVRDAKSDDDASVQSASYSKTPTVNETLADSDDVRPLQSSGKDADNSKVVTASSTRPTAKSPLTKSPATKSNVRSVDSPDHLPKLGNEWKEWHAFDPANPSGRKLVQSNPREQSKGPVAKTQPQFHDPLMDDPFSLNMIGQSAEASKPEPTLKNGPAPNSNSVVANSAKRPWRDPRALREARASGLDQTTDEPFNRMAEDFAQDSTIVVSTASSNSIGSMQNNSGVRSAEFDAASPSGASMPAVNWYGVSNPAQPRGTSSAYTDNTRPTVSNTNLMNGALANVNIADLQVALNEMVAGPTTNWNLTPLAERTRYLTEHGPNSIDRGHARLLLERIEAFQNLAVRSGYTAPSSPVQPAGYSAPISSPMTSGSPSVTTNFDATGWLVPVHAAAPDQPSHAITNDSGDVLAYVSGIPGLNLDRYKNQAVGITGLRGYLPQLHAPHIQAQRISQLK